MKFGPHRDPGHGVVDDCDGEVLAAGAIAERPRFDGRAAAVPEAGEVGWTWLCDIGGRFEYRSDTSPAIGTVSDKNAHEGSVRPGDRGHPLSCIGVYPAAVRVALPLRVCVGEGFRHQACGSGDSDAAGGGDGRDEKDRADPEDNWGPRFIPAIQGGYNAAEQAANQ